MTVKELADGVMQVIARGYKLHDGISLVRQADVMHRHRDG